jgi:hypothetical protein
MKQNYRDRAMKARDPRFAKIANSIGYGTRHLTAAAPAPQPPTEDISAVRAEYERAVGKRAYHGWDVPTLRAKIAEAKE